MIDNSLVWTPERQELARVSCLKWHGTPHRDRMASVGQGVDCVNFIAQVLFDAGTIDDARLPTYTTSDGMWAESTRLQEAILACVRGDWIEAGSGYEFGDVLVLKTGRRSAHCAFYSGDDYIWHALAGRFVTRSDLALWAKEICGAIRLTATGLKQSPCAADLTHVR